MPSLLSCSAVGARPTSPTVCRTGNQADQSVVTAKGLKDELPAHWESTVSQLSALQNCGGVSSPVFLYLGMCKLMGSDESPLHSCAMWEWDEGRREELKSE